MSEELQEALAGFFLAAEYGRSDVIKALVEHSCGLLSLTDVVDPVTGRSPLHVAVTNGKKDALRVLLAAGFPSDHQSKKEEGNEHGNQSAYALAQELKAEDLVLVFHQFLIQKVAANDVLSVKQLLTAGVDVGVTDAATGGSLLHWAASCDAVDVMKELLKREDVERLKLINARNGEGATPLHLACHANHFECVKMLLAHHADVSVKGNEGFSKDKRAVELATKPEVVELLSQVESDGNGIVKEPEADDGSGDRSDEGDSGETSCSMVATGTCVHEVESGKLVLQLEEKDLLVKQLRKTIEVLVQESQESQMLGEERVMLNYVRKLRDEKAIIERKLEDASDYIKDQQRQLDQLKEQIRQMTSADKELKTDGDMLSRTTSSVSGCPPDSTNSNMSVLDLRQLETHFDEEDTGLEKPQAQALKLDAWTSKAQREHETFNRYVNKHGSDIWSTVWNGIWAGTSEVTRDEDDEVVMTV